MVIQTARSRGEGAGVMGHSGREVPYPAPGEGSVSLLDDAVDELYALDLDRFIPRRNELAKAAKADGDKEAAAAIGGLRKPTQSAFTINRLARTDPGAIDALVEVGTDLQRAQTAGDGKALRELNTQRRRLLDQLTRRAFEIIGQQSPTAGQREEVTATLTAALADTGVADQLRQGILVRAAESSGFGFSPPELTLIRSPRPAAAAEAPPERETPSTPSKADEKDDQQADQKAVRERAAEARADAARAKQERERAAHDRAVAAAQAEADAADAAVQDAVDRAGAAQQLITRLQRELSAARRALEEAQKQTKTAEQKQKSARAALNKVRG